MTPPKIIDAEYRVHGENRWRPFRRWAAEMRWKMIASVLGADVADWSWWRQLLYAVWMLFVMAVAYAISGPLFRFFMSLIR